MIDKVKNYTIVSSDSEKEFIEKVNEMIVKGWELYGSTIVTANGRSHTHFIQPMTKL